jgi:hypothetical protein
LRSPGESREARLRIGIYFANNLVQSQLLTARIEDTERSGAGHHSRTDYTLTSFLADVSFLPQRAFHVLTNDSPEGSHSLVIKGEGQGVLALQLTEGQMRSAMQAARQFLRDAHIEETKGLFGGKNLRSLLDSNNAKDKPQFVADLKQLASLGFELWAMLFENQSKWWPLLRKPGTIQVSRTGGSRFVFPWAMVYDLPLEPGDPAKYQECRLLKEWEHAANGLDGHSRSCPFEAEHDLNTICPFGFWGFKHVIEQPPSMPEGRNLPLDIRVLSPPPRLIAGLSRKLNAATTKNHLEHLAPVVECDSLASVRTNLSPDVEIVYFYVHGKRKDLPGASEPGAVLELGEGESFEPHHLVAWRSYGWPEKHWQDVSPLVFINGCHTAEITPESLLSFVDSFSAACAAGVIGTEIALEQRLASEVAERFFAHFRANEGVGDAMQATRIELLRKGNLLGLAYTPYCSAALRLS